MRQLSEFLAPKNKCPENSAHKSRLADKLETNQPWEQRKTINHCFKMIKHNAFYTANSGFSRTLPHSFLTKEKQILALTFMKQIEK
ncbi:hypothetical protein EM64_021520 [Vibrio parahaemolyticus]|nr:hypothetical protein EM64_021520 [Vibrio parahaemolyticus]